MPAAFYSNANFSLFLLRNENLDGTEELMWGLMTFFMSQISWELTYCIDKNITNGLMLSCQPQQQFSYFISDSDCRTFSWMLHSLITILLLNPSDDDDDDFLSNIGRSGKFSINIRLESDVSFNYWKISCLTCCEMSILKVVDAKGNFVTLIKRWEDIVNGVEGCFAKSNNSKIFEV